MLSINRSGKDLHLFNNLIIKSLSLKLISFFPIFAVRARAQVVLFLQTLDSWLAQMEIYLLQLMPPLCNGGAYKGI